MKRLRFPWALPFLAAALFVLGLPAAFAAPSLSKVHDFGDNPGSLGMYEYVPVGLKAGAPLVVALHGCTQTPRDYDDEPGWLQVADRYGFALVFPAQSSMNQQLSCFNWFNPADQHRGKGEPASIVAMVDYAVKEHHLDSKRVYVAGLSGGAAMVSVMLAAYPDRFAGGASFGGIAYLCTTGDNVLGCMGGVSENPKAWGDKVREANPDYHGPWPRVSIWQGSADSVINPDSLRELMKQWTNVHGAGQEPTVTENVGPAEHKIYEKDGKAVVETWMIKGMGHGTPIDPGDGPHQCGKPSEYSLDKGICAVDYVARFWGIAGN